MSKAWPKYRSHKEVTALKIGKLQPSGSGLLIHFEDEEFEPVHVTLQDLEQKPQPRAGMYFIRYEDGYFSFSPAETFDGGYARTDTQMKGPKK